MRWFVPKNSMRTRGWPFSTASRCKGQSLRAITARKEIDWPFMLLGDSSQQKTLISWELVRPTRFERATPAFGGQYSIHLSYRRLRLQLQRRSKGHFTAKSLHAPCLLQSKRHQPHNRRNVVKSAEASRIPFFCLTVHAYDLTSALADSKSESSCRAYDLAFAFVEGWVAPPSGPKRRFSIPYRALCIYNQGFGKVLHCRMRIHLSAPRAGPPVSKIALRE